MRKRHLFTLFALGGLAACGSGAGADQGSALPTLGSTVTDASDAPTASDATDATQPTDDGTTSTSVDPQEAALAFSQCMRDNGIEDFPDPQFGDNGQVMIGIGGPGPDGDGGPTRIDQEAMQAAMDKCQPLMAQGGSFGPPDEKTRQEMQDKMLAFAECMREHGIDFPDPTFDGDGMFTVGVAGGETGAPPFDPTDPDFQDAQEACGSDMPGFSVSSSGGTAGVTQP